MIQKLILDACNEIVSRKCVSAEFNDKLSISCSKTHKSLTSLPYISSWLFSLKKNHNKVKISIHNHQSQTYTEPDVQLAKSHHKIAHWDTQ